MTGLRCACLPICRAAGATLSSSAANPTREQVSSARSKSSKKLERTSSKGSQSSKLNGSARRLAGEEEATLDSDQYDAYDSGLAGMMDDMVRARASECIAMMVWYSAL